MSFTGDFRRVVVLGLVALALTLAYFLWPGTLPVNPENLNGDVNLSPVGISQILPLTYDEFEILLKKGDVFLADARDSAAFAAGHIPGAVNIPYDRAEDMLDELEAMDDRPATLICYCDGSDCGASMELAHRLYYLFTTTYDFNGGWRAWQEHHD